VTQSYTEQPLRLLVGGACSGSSQHFGGTKFGIKFTYIKYLDGYTKIIFHYHDNDTIVEHVHFQLVLEHHKLTCCVLWRIPL